MTKLRLLERITAKNSDNELLSYTNERILASVHEYITKLLNTRRGSTLIDHDFGIPDFTNSGASFSNDDIPLMEKEIETFLTKYEPRFQNIQVHFVSEEKFKGNLQFAIEGQFVVEGTSTIRVRWFTDVSPLGKFNIYS